ncbi:hypothetical protein MSPP1_001652 [Malassezia sp. CBS 17886]|nr:hypothetical protein MSPP1_001652 [Malassezia sp. CBS 17886]
MHSPRSPLLAARDVGVFASPVPAHYSPHTLDADAFPDTVDSDVYGVPSDDERETGPVSRSDAHAKRTSLGVHEDDVPLGQRSAALVHAHERIIQHEKKAQNEKTLMILEGRHQPRVGADVRRAGSLASLPRARVPPSPVQAIGPPGVGSTLLRAKTSVRAGPTAPVRSAKPRRAPQWAEGGGERVDVGSCAPAHAVGQEPGSNPSVHVRTPAAALTSPPLRAPAPRATHRIFVGSLQRYTVVTLPADALVLQVTQQAQVQMGLGPCGERELAWALHDVLPDAGLAERPLREFERVDDVVAARGASAAYFLLKPTEAPALLQASAVPSSSALLGGWVSVQVDGRKWTRTWLELREHCVWTAKSESGKNAALLCSLLDTDIYAVDAHRCAVPKPYGFALRRQSGDAAPAVALVSQADGAAQRDWMGAIMRARAYVLRQERPELFAALAAVPRLPMHAPDLSLRVRSDTQDRTPSHGVLAAPLIAPSDLSVQFQQGSLLARREGR